ncbi:SGNH/GDSL hydrolase family protein [Actinoplanes sp. G11-F43]|uniref:SGNH/GDSL hydrolase family protein n=1 Tax=Actinoplanes sp. G11-F43 TaxID=3424130 RepID=UPI003D353944
MIILFGLLTVVAVPVAVLAVLVAQIREVDRTVPLAVQPPPRVEGLFGPRSPGPPLRMAVLGDSFAAGYGVAKPRETVGVLLAGAVARHLRRRVLLHRVAVVGAMSSDLAHQVDAALRHEPEVAVVYIGGNDVTRFAPLDRSARELGAAVARLRAAGCRVFVGTCPNLRILPPLRPPLRWLAAWRSARLAAAQTAAVLAAGGHPISLSELLNPHFEADPARMFGPDRFHPSAAGYAKAAAVSLPTLLAALRAEGVVPRYQPEWAPRSDGTAAARP